MPIHISFSRVVTLKEATGKHFLHHFAVFLVVGRLSEKGCVLLWLRRAAGRAAWSRDRLLSDLPPFLFIVSMFLLSVHMEDGGGMVACVVFGVLVFGWLFVFL